MNVVNKTDKIIHITGYCLDKVTKATVQISPQRIVYLPNNTTKLEIT